MFSEQEIVKYFEGVSFGAEVDKIKIKLSERVLSLYNIYKDVTFPPSRWPSSLDLMDDVHFEFAVKKALAELLQ